MGVCVERRLTRRCCQVKRAILGMPARMKEARVLDGKGGQTMRASLCRLIECQATAQMDQVGLYTIWHSFTTTTRSRVPHSAQTGLLQESQVCALRLRSLA